MDRRPAIWKEFGMSESSPREGTASPPVAVRDSVVQRLLKEIAGGTLTDARKRLPSERDLAERLGVSRPSIREALRHLRAQGVIELPNRARAKVLELDSDAFFAQFADAARLLLSRQHIANFQEARALFEGALARYAARHATPKQVDLLAHALSDNARALGDIDRFIETDRHFHEVLAAIPGNPIFVAINQALAAWIAEQRAEGLTVADSDRDAHAGHEAILAAIAARDPEGAERAMTDHLTQVSAYYRKAAAHRASAA